MPKLKKRWLWTLQTVALNTYIENGGSECLTKKDGSERLNWKGRIWMPKLKRVALNA